MIVVRKIKIFIKNIQLEFNIDDFEIPIEVLPYCIRGFIMIYYHKSHTALISNL